MKNYILYNNLSGNGASYEKATHLASLLGEDSIFLNVEDVVYSNLFAELKEDDNLIICGGDGTLNRFVNDTKEMGFKCKVLYYPTGTGNDFLKDINITENECPVEINKYIDSLPSVEINGKSYYFLNNVGFGIDGYCCEVGDDLKKRGKKKINYTAIAIKGLLFHYKPTNAVVTVDGKEYSYKKVWIAPTMNGRFYGGGMMATPSQDRCSDEISVMVFYGGGRLKTLLAFPSIFKGEHIKHTDMVQIHSGKQINVKFSEPRTVQIDGETLFGISEYNAKSN